MSCLSVSGVPRSRHLCGVHDQPYDGRQRGGERFIRQACATCRLGVGTAPRGRGGRRHVTYGAKERPWERGTHPYDGSGRCPTQAGRPEKRRRPAGRCKETRSGAAARELMRALPLPRSAESPDTTEATAAWKNHGEHDGNQTHERGVRALTPADVAGLEIW